MTTILLTTALPARPPTEFLIFPMGDFETSKGKFTFDRASAKSVLAHWRGRGVDLSIDYDHGMVFGGQEPAEAGKASTKAGVIARTLVHEIGHHLFNHLPADVQAKFEAERLAKPKNNGFFLTEYAKRNYHEEFAERFAAYIFHRNELRDYDSDGYAQIKEAMSHVR